MGGPTFWEVHEYRNGSPTLAFQAGAGEHPNADQYGTRWYVNREDGWRDGVAMRDAIHEYAQADGAWVGDLRQGTHTVTLYGTWIAPSQEAMFASLRAARSVLAGRYRTGRLLADDSDGRRLYRNVTLGSRPAFDPVTSTYGEWSIVFTVADTMAYSETTRSVALSSNVAVGDFGVGFPMGFPMGFNNAQSDSSSVIDLGGNAYVPAKVTFTGPMSDFILTDRGSGNSMTANGLGMAPGDTAVLDSASRTFRVNGQNRRWAIAGNWPYLAPGENEILFAPSGGSAGTSAVVTYPEEVWI